MALTPTNLTIPAELVKVAKEYVQKRKKTNRGFSLSELTTGLLVSHLRSKGVKLPPEFSLK
jgi:ribosomal protein L13E